MRRAFLFASSRRLRAPALLLSRVVVLVMGIAAPVATASAGNNACGGIEVANIEACRLADASGSCDAFCAPENLVVACNGRCDEPATTSCLTAIESECAPICGDGDAGGGGAAGPEAFSCLDHCRDTCLSRSGCVDGDGDAACAFLSNNCDARCLETCAEPNLTDCNACLRGGTVGCQAEAQRGCLVGCSEDLDQECNDGCRSEEGNLVCDGQYISTDDLPACRQFLREQYGVSIDLTPTDSFDTACAVGRAVGGAPAGSGDDDDDDPFGMAAGLVAALGAALGARHAQRRLMS
ncbi:MAG: hypothetical protein AAF928_12295 [Myxococcota bacterium]